jgi:hypothetical protein
MTRIFTIGRSAGCSAAASRSEQAENGGQVVGAPSLEKATSFDRRSCGALLRNSSPWKIFLDHLQDPWSFGRY